MRAYAVNQAYTRWVLADYRYQQARLEGLGLTLAGEEKERRAHQLASLAKAAKDAADAHLQAIEEARDREAGFF